MNRWRGRERERGRREEEEGEGRREERVEEEGDSEAELTLLNQSGESLLEEARPRLIINIMSVKYIKEIIKCYLSYHTTSLLYAHKFQWKF